MNKNNMDVSIILPCHNESRNLENAVKSITTVMDQSRYKYEIIIVEDGSTDGTDKIALDLTHRFKNIVWLHRDKRLGRGSGVENGILNAKSLICGFMDVDLATPAHYIPILVSEIENGADMVTALRICKLSFQPKVFLRWVTHKGYKLLSHTLISIPIEDTETGCKFFRKDKILPYMDEIEDKHWFWDTEIIVRGLYHNLKIIELPTICTRRQSSGSTVSLVRDTKRYLINLFKFKKQLKKYEMLHKEVLNK